MLPFILGYQTEGSKTQDLATRAVADINHVKSTVTVMYIAIQYSSTVCKGLEFSAHKKQPHISLQQLGSTS